MLDAGLETEFEYIKLLGKGGTGETHLYRERKTGQLLAIKLVPRPLPRVLHESILREITVCLSSTRTTRHHVLCNMMLPRLSTCELSATQLLLSAHHLPEPVVRSAASQNDVAVLRCAAPPHHGPFAITSCFI